MKSRFGPLLVFALALSLTASFALAHDGDKETLEVRLKYKVYQKWNFDLPQETLTPVSGTIPIAHAGGPGLLANADGLKLEVDSDGDGKLDKDVKGTGGVLKLELPGEDGKARDYAIRITSAGGWRFAASGAMVGRVRGTTIRLIDQNNNGRYDEIGKDAMIVGKTNAASFLSRVVNLDGELFELSVDPDGSRISLVAYEGARGHLDLRSGFESDGARLLSAVVVSESGDVSFDAAAHKSGLAVPAGTYRIVHGRVEKGSESARIKTGKMKPIQVAADQPSEVAWGGPINAVFNYTNQNGVLTIRPTDLWFYGKAGEEYVDWVPDGAGPKFVVKDAETDRVLLEARFGGC